MHTTTSPATRAANLALALSTPGARARAAASEPKRMVELVALGCHTKGDRKGSLMRGQMTCAMKRAHPKPKQRLPLGMALLLR